VSRCVDLPELFRELEGAFRLHEAIEEALLALLE
jgi:hypothetical protein